MHDQDPRIGWFVPVVASILVHECVMELRIVREIFFRMARPGSVRNQSDRDGREKVLVVFFHRLFPARICCHRRAPNRLSSAFW
jgi:hypothetical protein